MCGHASIAVFQLHFPPVEQPQAFLATRRFVGQILRPTAISVDGVKMWTEFGRQEPAGNGKVLVMRLSQPATVRASLGQRQIANRPTRWAVSMKVAGECGTGHAQPHLFSMRAAYYDSEYLVSSHRRSKLI